MIKSVYESQAGLLKDMTSLYGNIHCDLTYSKGNFYKSLQEPVYKCDINPVTEAVTKCDSTKTHFEDNSLTSIMFDPPFLAGYTKESTTGIIGNRFSGFRYMKDAWQMYYDSIREASRILKSGGIYYFKIQDTVSSGKQYWSSQYVINTALANGFVLEDMFILVAKNRIIGHNHANQKHARKFHSYFLVFKKVSNV